MDFQDPTVREAEVNFRDGSKIPRLYPVLRKSLVEFCVWESTRFGVCTCTADSYTFPFFSVTLRLDEMGRIHSCLLLDVVT